MAADDQRISVSREMLRADLAEMKLDLIEKLASREQVAGIDARLGIVERTALFQGGPVDQAVKKNIEAILSEAELTDLVDARIAVASGKTWTSRDRLVAAVLALIAVSTFLLNVFHPFAGTPPVGH